jgi:hypothetical protein
MTHSPGQEGDSEVERHSLAQAGAMIPDTVASREAWPRYSAAALRAAPLSTRARRERNRRVWRRFAIVSGVLVASLLIGLWAGPLLAQLLGIR